MRYLFIFMILLTIGSCGKKKTRTNSHKDSDIQQAVDLSIEETDVVVFSIRDSVVEKPKYKITCDTIIAYYLNTQTGSIYTKNEVECDSVLINKK